MRLISPFLALTLLSIKAVTCVPVPVMSQYSVEILVVVDNLAYRQWLEVQSGHSQQEKRHKAAEAVRDYVRSSFAAANLILHGLTEHGLRLDARILDVVVIQADEAIARRVNNRTLTAQDHHVARDFWHWLVRNGYEFDHALLVTGYDLLSGVRSRTEGYAYMSTMCAHDSLSIVENTMNGILAVVFAHELGHSLGAYHDGDHNDCNATSGFIMNDNDIGLSTKRWSYSSCSAESILGKIRQLSRTVDCISEDSTNSAAVEAPFLGQRYSADVICQMTYGSTSYVCRHLYGVGRQENICHIMWCYVNATYCSGIASADGVVCGAGKRCVAGSCVPFDDVPAEVTDTCYLGDMPHPVWRGQTCNEVIGRSKHNCLDNWYQTFCCRSCQRAHTGNDACPYGDAYNTCSPLNCGTEWDAECCSSCPQA